MGMFKDAFFGLEKTQTHKTCFWCKRILHGIVWSSGGLDYNEYQNSFPKDVTNRQCFNFRRGQKIANFSANYWIKMCKTWMILAVLKVEIANQLRKCGFARVTYSDTRSHLTVQSSMQNWLVTGQCSIWSCKFCIGKSVVSIYKVNSFKSKKLFILDAFLIDWA